MTDSGVNKYSEVASRASPQLGHCQRYRSNKKGQSNGDGLLILDIILHGLLIFWFLDISVSTLLDSYSKIYNCVDIVCLTNRAICIECLSVAVIQMVVFLRWCLLMVEVMVQIIDIA